MTQNPSPQWDKLLSSFLCVTFTLCSSKTGRSILGPIFLGEFINGIINETNLFIRRQCAENVCALFKNNNENKELFTKDKENLQLMKSLISVIRNVGDFRLQATVIEILARVHLWKNIVETKLKKVFSELINPEKIIEEFKKIRSNENFVKDIRNFINFLNKGFADKCMVFSFPSSSIKIGSYETNPEWVDFGQKGISLFLTFPGGEGHEALDIEYSNIRGLRLGYKSNEVSLQLLKNLEGFEEYYQWDNDNHKISISMSNQDLMVLKTKVAPVITEERKKQKEQEVATLNEKSSIVIQTKPKDPETTKSPEKKEEEEKKDEEKRLQEEKRRIQQEKEEEQRRIAEENKRIEEEKAQEEKRKKEEERIIEERRKEEEKRAEEKRKEEERERQKIIEEERRENEKREEERKREEKRKKEEEKRKEEERKKKEEKKKKEEEELKKRSKTRNTRKKKEIQDESEEEEEVPKRGKSLPIKSTKKKNITEEDTNSTESTKEYSIQSPSTPSQSTLIDWNSLFKAQSERPNKVRIPLQKEENNPKKCLFPSNEVSTDTTFGDFLPPEENERPKKRKAEELTEETEIGDLLISLQNAIQQKAQKKLKMAENIATKTAENIKEKIDKVKEERNKERTEIFNSFTKNYNDLKEKSTTLSRKLQSSYQKFQLEISNQMKSHTEITNQIAALKDSYNDKLKSCGTKDEIECQKLEKFIKEEIIRMEKEIKVLEMDNSAITKLKELLAQEIE